MTQLLAATALLLIRAFALEEQNALSPCNAFTLDSGLTTIDFASKKAGPRQATVYVPRSLNKTVPVPLVVYFHGWTNSCQDFGAGCTDKMCNFKEAAETRGFIFAAMCGSDNSFNAGACCPPSNSEAAPVDDVAAAKALVRRLSKSACIDPRRVYATGYSNGGMLVHRLACEAPDVFRAFASVAGTIALRSPDDSSGLAVCTIEHRRVGSRGRVALAASEAKGGVAAAGQGAVAMLDIHGSEDVYVPYNGSSWLGLASVDESFQVWAELGRCKGKPVTVVDAGQEGQDEDGTAGNGDVRVRTWDSRAGCAPGVLHVSMLLSGSEHEWMRTPLDATSVVLDFFDRAARASGMVVSHAPATGSVGVGGFTRVSSSPSRASSKARAPGGAGRDRQAKGKGRGARGTASPSPSQSAPGHPAPMPSDEQLRAYFGADAEADAALDAERHVLEKDTADFTGPFGRGSGPGAGSSTGLKGEAEFDDLKGIMDELMEALAGMGSMDSGSEEA